MTRLIKDKSPTKRPVNPKTIAKALGAEDTRVEIDTRRGPISLFTLRQFLADRLRSTGGRPKLAGTTQKRNKISFFKEDWEKLEVLAKYYREHAGIKVSSGQIASTLMHAQLSKLDTSKMYKKKLKLRVVSK